MSNRIMKIILSKKHKALVNSIKDDTVKELVRKNTIITGGCIASMLLKEEIHDFDIYFTNFETCKAVTEYYVNQFMMNHNDLKIKPEVVIESINKETISVENSRVRIKIKSAGIVGETTKDNEYAYFEGNINNGNVDQSLMNEGEDYVEKSLESPELTLEKADNIDDKTIGSLHGYKTEKGEFRPIFLSDNAISLSDKTQLIIRFYGNPEGIHKNFDFVHATNYWRSDTKELVLNKEALTSLLTKQLHYMNSQYPICALIRIRKFMKRGFHIDAGQILKICFQISKLDLTDINVLEEQLTGVDKAYFQQLINYIEQEKAKDENWILELPYLVSVIDKIF